MTKGVLSAEQDNEYCLFGSEQDDGGPIRG